MSSDPARSVSASTSGPTFASAVADLERGFFAAAPGCILLVDPDTGTIREANAACAAWTGYLREELAGMTLQGLTAPEDRRDRATGALDRLRERGEPLRMDVRYLRRDGRTVWGATAMTPLTGEDGRTGTIVVQIDDLTERKRSDADRRLADLRFRRLVEEIPAAVFALPLEPGSAVSYLSPRIAELTGRDPAELEGSRRFLEPFIHPDDAPAVHARRDEAEHTLAPYAVRFRLQRADGSWTWLDERGMVVRDELGVPRYWQGILVDASAEMTGREALVDSEALFRSTFEHGAIGMAVVDAEGRIVDANPAFCAMLGRARDEMAGLSWRELSAPAWIAANTALFDELRRGERDTYVLEKDYLRPDGSTLSGVLSVSAVRDSAGRLVRAVSQVEDVTDEREAQAALAESEALFRSTFEHAGIGMALLDPTGRLLDANPAICAFFGLAREEVLRRTFRELTHPDDLALDVERFEALVAGQIAHYRLDKRYLRADGGIAWGRLNVSGVRGDDGRIERIIGQVEDITAARAAQAALAEGEALFRSTFDDAAIGMTIADEEGRFITVNPAFGSMLGRASEELVGVGYREITHPADLALSDEAAARMNAGETGSYQVEKRYLHRDGHPVWCRLNVSCVREPDGRIARKISQVEDISARKAAEAALVESEALFRSTFDGAAIGMTVLGADRRFVDVNPAMCRMLGYERSELLGLTPDDVTHPDDLPANAVSFLRFDVDRPATQTFEKRFLRKDGAVVWARLNVAAIRLPDGTVERLVGQVEDITARKVAEQALSTSEALFRSSFENAAIGMALADPNGRLTDANPAFCRLLGYSRDELAEMDFAAFTHPDDLPRELAEIARVRSGEIDRYHLEKRYIRKDGGVVWVNFNGAAVRGPGCGFVLGIGQVEDITAFKAAQTALAESETHLRELFENAAAGIAAVDAEGRMLEPNPAFRRMLGYAPDELQGMTFQEMTCPDDLPAALTTFRRLMAGETDRDVVETRMIRRDGGIVWTRSNASCVRGRDGAIERVIAQVEDVSAIHLARQSLATSEQRFRALVERSTDTMVVVDAEGTVRWASPAIMGLLGRAPEDVVGLPRQALLHPDDRAAATEAFLQVLEAPFATVRTDVRLAHADGSWRWVEVSAANHLDNPAVGGLVYNIRDISERKEAERAIAEALDMQRRANDELVAVGQQRSEFLAMLAHDFRTPLTSIQGYSELLKLGAGGNPEIASEADVIHESAVRLNRMVEDMLTVETLEKRLAQLDRKPTDIGQLVRDAAEVAAGAWPARAIELDLAAGLPELDVDRDQLARAVANLVGNALKYSPEGEPIRVSTRLAGDAVEIAVEDNGFGIAADQLETIFDKYARVRTRETENVPGVGLGLPIVRAIARAHGGDAWAASERGVGSTFRLSLPVGIGASGAVRRETGRGGSKDQE